MRQNTISFLCILGLMVAVAGCETEADRTKKVKERAQNKEIDSSSIEIKAQEYLESAIKARDERNYQEALDLLKDIDEKFGWTEANKQAKLIEVEVKEVVKKEEEALLKKYVGKYDIVSPSDPNNQYGTETYFLEQDRTVKYTSSDGSFVTTKNGNWEINSDESKLTVSIRGNSGIIVQEFTKKNGRWTESFTGQYLKKK